MDGVYTDRDGARSSFGRGGRGVSVRQGLLAIAFAVLLALSAMPASTTRAATGDVKHYLVVFAGDYALDGSFELGGSYALNYAAALSLVQAAGGSVTT
ncbi:MAG TPA: hypothetical protein VLA19_24255, partial [Herpetosiphonaceae bacterium]|nr:hypothetical protein [Herpetosiphonaceae bacterium]